MDTTSGETTADYERFEQLYQERQDPWDYYSAAEQAKYARMAEAAKQWQPTPQRVLEVACSLGYLTEKLAHYAPEVFAFDISPTAVERTRERCAKIESQTKFHIDLGDAIRPAYPAGSFDVIFVGDVIRILPGDEERRQSLRNLLSLLTTDGVLILTDCMKANEQQEYIALVAGEGGDVREKLYYHDRYWIKFRSLAKRLGNPEQIRPLLESGVLHSWLSGLGRLRGPAGSKHFGLVVKRGPAN